MDSVFQTFKEVAEAISFLTSPVLAYLAWRALDQIKTAKEASIISAKRDALKLTAEECRFYSGNIIPLYDEIARIIEKENVHIFKGHKTTIQNNKLTVYYQKRYESKTQIPDELYGMLTSLTNKLESYATFFISGVADEKIAYQVQGESYCRVIEAIAPAYVALNQTLDDNYTINLYFLWRARLNISDAKKQKGRLEDMINSHQERSIKIVGIPD